MKQKSSRRTVLAAAMAVAGVFGLITSPAFADVHVSQNGATLTVTAPSTLAGKGLVLQTDAESSGTWTTKANIVGAVPAAGGVYTVDLAALGIANGTPCRIASATCYERLDKLLMADRGKYINTGIQGKNVYGVKMGFYPTTRGTTGTVDANFALNCGKGGDTSWTAGKGGFHIGLRQCSQEEHDAGITNAELEGPVMWGHHGYGSMNLERPNWSTNVLNDIAFTNCVFTLNGVTIKSGLNAGAISTNELNVTMGRNNSTDYYSLCGYWGWLRLDDENGDAIIDYVPVRRASDRKVGFWDSVSKSLVVPTTENQNLSVGEGVETGEIICDDSTLEVVAADIVPNRQLACSSEAGVVTISVPSGIAGESIIVAWDSADKGDDLDDWANSATLTDSATEGDLTARLSRLGIRNGDYVRVFAANVYKPLDKLFTNSGKQSYITTEFTDTEVYGVKFGFYGSDKAADWGYFIGTQEKDASGNNYGGFVIGMNGTYLDSWFWVGYGRRSANGSDRPSVNTNSINEVAFTNKVITVNDTTVYSVSSVRSLGSSGKAITIGTTTDVVGGNNPNRFLYGWWSHVSFYDVDDNTLLDYIPVQRVSDAKVGFYDRASLSFVTSSGTGDFTAGNVTNDTPVVAVNASSAAWEVTDIQGLIIFVE